MTNQKIVFAVIALFLLTFANLVAQGRGYNNQLRNYNVNTVETVKGEVLNTSTEEGKGRSIGLHAVIKTDKGNLPVHIGPVWYLKNINLNIEEGDQVEIVGSRIDYEGESTIIAAEVTIDKKTYNLRKENGIPNWAGNQGGRRNTN